MKHRGIIRISNDLLLKWLAFVGGEIVDIYPADALDFISIVIEHPDMPEVQKGESTQLLQPAYITYQDGIGHKVTMRKEGKV